MMHTDEAPVWLCVLQCESGGHFSPRRIFIQMVCQNLKEKNHPGTHLICLYRSICDVFSKSGANLLVDAVI